MAEVMKLLLIDTFNDYIDLLEQLDDFDIHQEKTRKINAKEVKKKALRLGKAIVQAITQYNYGKPHEAFKVLQTELDSDRFLKTQIFLGGEDFYRVRVSESKSSLSKQDLFLHPL
ncbi:MAG: hypothetical protein IPO32_03675 [Crocinitomicaceae bacterium]|nr:hypothetical protein [Crocinitomicaceae bacterium]